MNTINYYILIIFVIVLFIIIPTIIYCSSCCNKNKIKIKNDDNDETSLLV